MDFSFLSPVLQDLASAAITVGIGAGVVLLKQYTGIQISAANEDSIRSAATTEAGKLIVTGLSNSPAQIATSAAKVIADLPKAVASEGYTHSDITDMITGATATILPPAAALVPAISAISSALTKPTA
jgi:hypothetical protein